MSTPATRMRCHYEVLGVERDVTADEVKKQYRKLALKLHPDRNFGREEEAARDFKELSSAYSVLIDPHERQWYDDHREAILRGKDPSRGGGGDEDEEDLHTVNLWAFFNTSCYDGMGDDETGFFGVYSEVFAEIRTKELDGSNQGTKSASFNLPAFGNSQTDAATKVTSFYVEWENFVSELSFGWMDQYYLPDAPNRQVKRAMEKENTKLRDSARKEYVSRVRSLVAFVKKRDPRILALEEERKKKREEEEQRRAAIAAEAKEKHKKARDAWKLGEAERERERELERHGKYLLADNDSDLESVDEINQHGDSDNEATDAFANMNISDAVLDGVDGECVSYAMDYEAEEIEEEVFHCEACAKTFKTEAQLNQHLSSKVHRKRVQDLAKASKKGGKA